MLYLVSGLLYAWYFIFDVLLLISYFGTLHYLMLYYIILYHAILKTKVRQANKKQQLGLKSHTLSQKTYSKQQNKLQNKMTYSRPQWPNEGTQENNKLKTTTTNDNYSNANKHTTTNETTAAATTTKCGKQQEPKCGNRVIRGTIQIKWKIITIMIIIQQQQGKTKKKTPTTYIVFTDLCLSDFACRISDFRNLVAQLVPLQWHYYTAT